MGKTKQILKGNFPEENLTLDQQVKIVNKATDKLAEADEIDDSANNLFLWLGGLDRDIQLYACQRLFNYKGVSFNADDKTEARLSFMEPFFEYIGEGGYTADTYQAIDHRPWPIEHLDGSTFEDRLADLADEMTPELQDQITPDMVLTGVVKPVDIEADQLFVLIGACLKDLSERDKDIVYDERLENFILWVTELQPEFAIMAMKTALSIYELPLVPKKSPAFKAFVGIYKETILIGASM